MDFDEYQKEVRKGNDVNMMHAIIGLSGEVGEVQEILKKALFCGRVLDVDHLGEELGDVLWYLTRLTTLFNIRLSDIAEKNIDKTRERYPRR